MTAVKERAVQIIENMPDNEILYVLNIIENLQKKKPSSKSVFEKYQGKIEIDEKSIEELREKSMV